MILLIKKITISAIYNNTNKII